MSSQTPDARPGPYEDELRSVLTGSIENLLSVYDEQEALFPYSTRIHGDSFVNDFRRPDSLRYTINTLLGLRVAARAGIEGITTSEVDEMTRRFTSLHGETLTSRADLGLLVLLLCEGSDEGSEAAARAALDRLRTAVEGAGPADFHMQDLGWMIWGAAGAARRGLPGAEELGRWATGLVKEYFVDPGTGLPRHTTSRYRGNVVSFGSLVYFLRAMHEASTTFGDGEAAQLFSNGVRRAIELQGPLGEWPWMIHVGTGTTFDVYPVFSVHQDSMAMLFLLPALDAGAEGVNEAVTRSVAWCFGANELGVRFYLEQPFFAYRSIERADRAPRLRRYLRFLTYSVTHRPAAYSSARTRVNDECRSYHLGWILFAWSERLAARAPAGP